MGGASVVWKVVKTAATRIPWGNVLENAPVVVDLVGRARERLAAGIHHDLDKQLKGLREENLKLTRQLQETGETVQNLSKALEVVSARLKMVTVVSVLSLLAAAAAIVLILVR